MQRGQPARGPQPPGGAAAPTCLNTRLAPLNRSGCTSSAGSTRDDSFWVNSMYPSMASLAIAATSGDANSRKA